MSKNIKSPPQLSPRPPVLFQKFRGLCFELIAATEGGLVLNYISPPSVMPSPGGRGPERRQHVMLFLASCSEGFVRKLGGGATEFSAWQYPCGERDITGMASADSRTNQIWVINSVF